MASVQPLFRSDISELRRYLRAMSFSEWEKWTVRQRHFGVHHQTYTIAFVWSVGVELPEEPFVHPNPSLTELVMPLANELAVQRGGTVVNCLLALLPTSKRIPLHSDHGSPTLEQSIRFHLPIISHPDVRFLIGDTILYMEEGQWYWVDNMQEHSVDNNSPVDRVHLIVDVSEGGV